MDISRYTSWFHDGSLEAIHHNIKSDEIMMEISSAQIIDWPEFDGKIDLSEEMMIVGNLHLRGIESITIDGKDFKGILKMPYEDGEIMHFKMRNNNAVELCILWHSKKKISVDCTTILIKAQEIDWENLPSRIR